MKRPISTWKTRWLIGLLALVLPLILWAILARAVNQTVLLPTPGEVLQTLWNLLGQGRFYKSLAWTFLRGLGGFSLAFGTALVSALLASKSMVLRRFMEPFLVLLRSVPLLALILLAVLWFRQERVSYFVVFLVIFPLIWGNVLEGIKSLPLELVEMSRVFNFSSWNRLRHIIIPHITPYILSGISTGLGIAWKAVIAAEILTMPAHGMGTAMQRAQLELDSASLFAWTFALLLLSGLCEVLIRLAEGRLPWRKRHVS